MEADHIVDNVFLGPEQSAISMDYLQANNIDRIVVAANHCTKAFSEQGIEYLEIPIDDSPTEEISCYFEPVLAFMQKRPTSVLVHCHSGISRSGAFIIAYVMKT